MTICWKCQTLITAGGCACSTQRWTTSGLGTGSTHDEFDKESIRVLCREIEHLRSEVSRLKPLAEKWEMHVHELETRLKELANGG